MWITSDSDPHRGFVGSTLTVGYPVTSRDAPGRKQHRWKVKNPSLGICVSRQAMVTHDTDTRVYSGSCPGPGFGCWALVINGHKGGNIHCGRLPMKYSCFLREKLPYMGCSSGLISGLQY